MTIKKIKIHNLRGITELDLDLGSRKVVCFVGENGSSKTTLLTSIVEAIISGTNLKYKNYSKDEKRYRLKSASEVQLGKKFYTSEIHYSDHQNLIFKYKKIIIADPTINQNEYSKLIQGVSHSSGSNEIHSFFQQEIDLKDEFISNNVFLYRPSQRYEEDGMEFNISEPQELEIINDQSLLGYLPYDFRVQKSGANSEKIILDILFDIFIGYRESEEFITIILSILHSITGVDFGNILVQKSPNRSITFSNKKHLRNLSQGELDILVTALNILYQQNYIKQKVGNKLEINKIPGVVLIDEVDLHLHPKAQEKYINVLSKSFPNIQFIITTHSPFIIRGLPEESLIVSLPNGMEHSDSFKNMTIDNITDLIFEYEGRFSKEVEQDIENFKLHVTNENLALSSSIYKKYTNKKYVLIELKSLLSTYAQTAEFISNVKSHQKTEE